jgi:hypothetical protein
MSKTPAWFFSIIHLSLADRLRVLVHGRLDYHAEIKPDPGSFEVEARVVVPPVFGARDRAGCEEAAARAEEKEE